MNCLLLLILMLSFSGCVEPMKYQVQVTGYNQPGAVVLPPPPAAFAVIANPEAKDPDLEKEIKGKIEKLLGIKGYILTAFEQADYYLVFSYAQGQTPAPPPPGYPPRGYGAAPPPYAVAPVPDYSGYGPPPLYNRQLLVNVIEGPRYREKKEFQRIWLGAARSTGTSANLRATLNYLLVALFEDFGKSTGRGRVVEVNEEDFRAWDIVR